MKKNEINLKVEESNVCTFAHLVYHPLHRQQPRQQVPVMFETSCPHVLYGYELSQIHLHQKTKYQDVIIADTLSFGRALMLDGSMQSAEFDEALYHEALVHPAMLAHPNPRKVLILGGGEGATLREILKYPSVESIVMVDIDGELVELAKRYLPTWHQGSFESSKVKVVIGDALSFLESDKTLYDVVIVDLIDSVNDDCVSPLYTKGFYQNIQKHLNLSGIVAVQGMEISFLRKAHFQLTRTLRAVYSKVRNYQVFIPSFMRSWGFILASNWNYSDLDSSAEISALLDARVGEGSLHHMTPEMIQHSFYSCRKTQDFLSRDGPIWE